MQCWLNMYKSITVIHHINKLKYRKQLTKFEIHSLYKKKTQQTRNRRVLKGYLKKNLCPTSYLCNKILNSFSLKSGARKEYLPSTLLFTIVFKVLASAFRQEKRRKSIRFGKEKVNLLLITEDMIIYSRKNEIYPKCYWKW